MLGGRYGMREVWYEGGMRRGNEGGREGANSEYGPILKLPACCMEPSSRS